MPILTDLHVHLYGCLTADDLFDLGKDEYLGHQKRLDWYADEYLLAHGVKPDWRSYWQDDNGFLKLKYDYCERPFNNFAGFQACFNLAIAILPPRSGDTRVLQKVLARQSEYLNYAEYRFFLPPYLSWQTKHILLTEYAHCALEFDGSMQPRLAMTLLRDQPELDYQILRSWQNENPSLAHAVVGVDFAMKEEGHPPFAQKDFVAQLKIDNESSPNPPLSLLYHVGESFQDKTLASAVRWIFEAYELGADRLGHCLALGIDPYLYSGKTVEECRIEFIAQQQWLLDYTPLLQDLGHKVEQRLVNSRLNEASGKTTKTHSVLYDSDFIEECSSLQRAIRRFFQAKKCVIETCPSSNLKIGGIPTIQDLPIKEFLQDKLNIHICSDDPGIFNTDLAKEISLLQEHFPEHSEYLQKSASLSHKYRSNLW